MGGKICGEAAGEEEAEEEEEKEEEGKVGDLLQPLESDSAPLAVDSARAARVDRQILLLPPQLTTLRFHPHTLSFLLFFLFFSLNILSVRSFKKKKTAFKQQASGERSRRTGGNQGETNENRTASDIAEVLFLYFRLSCIGRIKR